MLYYAYMKKYLNTYSLEISLELPNLRSITLIKGTETKSKIMILRVIVRPKPWNKSDPSKSNNNQIEKVEICPPNTAGQALS
jgi:hypothetical protein